MNFSENESIFKIQTEFEKEDTSDPLRIWVIVAFIPTS